MCTIRSLKLAKIINKPWGNEEIWASCEVYLGKIITIDANHRLSRQYHCQKEETIRVLSGVLHLEIGEKDNIQIILLAPGETYHIVPGTIHRFCAKSEEVKLLEVSTYYPDDVVRLEDDYNR